MLNNETLKNKTALITGSTSGIGAGIAKRLASYGANIAINGLGDQKTNEAFAAQIADEYNVQASLALTLQKMIIAMTLLIRSIVV